MRIRPSAREPSGFVVCLSVSDQYQLLHGVILPALQPNRQADPPWRQMDGLKSESEAA
jgi:hypothetical protein